MTAQFTLPAFDSEAFARAAEGHGFSMAVQVHGYWSRDPITLWIRRGGMFTVGAEVAEWTADISHSSGGRDTKVVASDVEASINFGCALIAVAGLAQQILARSAELEEAHQAYRARLTAEHAAAKAAQAAAFEADAAMGTTQARTVLGSLIAQAKEGAGRITKASIAFHRRGEQRYPTTIVVEFRRHTNVVLVDVGGKRVTKAAAIEAIAALSQRTEPAAA
jgi:hypothetical protein